MLFSPVKAIKGTCITEKQWNKAADDLYSAAVSSVREPIEAFFGWLINKTNIQKAQKCRSTAGLLIHTLVKLAIADQDVLEGANDSVCIGTHD